MAERPGRGGSGAGAALRVVAALRFVNRAVALLCGAVLLAAAGFVIAEIALRAMGGGLGGSDELSGYAMAAIAAWGLPWALAEGAHIRIEMALRRAPGPLRDALDLAALASVAVVAATVAWHGWGVVATSLARGSAANTPLETPLWMPQAVWWAGWTWFAATAAALTLCGAVLALARRSDALRAIAGADAS